LGLYDPGSKRFSFRYDGTKNEIDFSNPKRLTTVHHCYWKALDINDTIEPDEEDIVEINDEYEDISSRPDTHVSDIRTKHFGETLLSYEKITIGPAGQREYEQWVLRVLRVVFSGQLSTIKFEPSQDNITPRRAFAANMKNGKFWSRVAKDFDTSRVTILPVNNEHFELKDVALTIQSGEDSEKSLGRMRMLVTRNERRGLSSPEREILESVWQKKGIILFVLSANTLKRCFAKQESDRRDTYIETAISRDMDIVARHYAGAKEMSKYMTKSRRRKLRKKR
jgi:hypothetical protein